MGEGAIFLKSADEGKIMAHSAWPQARQGSFMHTAPFRCTAHLACLSCIYGDDAAAGLVGSKLTDRHRDRAAHAVVARG